MVWWSENFSSRVDTQKTILLKDYNRCFIKIIRRIHLTEVVFAVYFIRRIR
jgi:hypothetical protein